MITFREMQVNPPAIPPRPCPHCEAGKAPGATAFFGAIQPETGEDVRLFVCTECWLTWEWNDADDCAVPVGMGTLLFLVQNCVDSFPFALGMIIKSAAKRAAKLKREGNGGVHGED